MSDNKGKRPGQRNTCGEKGLTRTSTGPLFDAIARRYDLLNHLLSGGVDVYWRRRALAGVPPRPQRVLDLATGTGDLALAACRLEPGCVVGVDVALEMLRLGRGKIQRRHLERRVHLLAGDALCLPFPSGVFDLVTAAFGVRNFADIPAGLAEAHRVLVPGGQLVVLDFSEPRAPLFGALYRLYFRRLLPVVGGLVSGNRSAYAYLPRSVGSFPQGKGFLELLGQAGFGRCTATPLTLGICSLYRALKDG
ncbi:MAG: class I SAM-dependent methyltransferase [Candidatus Latescibacterota bacterium]